MGSYGATEPHLWLMSKIPQRTWDDCRGTSERKSRTHSYDELVDLLIELALERENDSHMEKFLKKHLGRGGTPTPERGERKGPKKPTNTNQGGGKGRGNLRAMNEVKPDAGTPPLFYCKPVNDKGGPCHAPDCDHRSTLRAHLDQVPLNYPSETVVQPSSTAHFHYGFPTVEPLSRYSNKLLSSNLKTAIFQPCKRCHTP